MTTYNWSALTNGQSIAFNPTTDVLFIDDTSISARLLGFSFTTSAPLTSTFTFSAKSITLQSNFKALTTTNLTFADGSLFLVGDNTTGVTNDDGANTLTGGNGDDQLIGLGGNDSMVGGAGDDIFAMAYRTGVFGNDTIDGGTGYDSLFYSSNSTNAANVNLATHIATNAQGNTTLVSIETVSGTAANDAFTGGDPAHGVDSLGNRIFERFRGEGGNDTITGGSGADFFTIADYANNTSTQAVSANLFTGTASDGRGGTDTLANVDGLRGGAGNDLLVGGSLSRSVNGFFFEILRGNAGNDTLDGGNSHSDGAYASSDRADYSNNTSAQAVNVNLSTGVALDGTGGTDTLIDIDHVYGGAGNDTLTGSAQSYDDLDGGAGNDTLDGGAGSDTARFQQSTAGVIVNLSAGSITVNGVTVAAGTANDGMGGTDTLISIENVRGSDFDDYIRGSDDANTRQFLAGSAGNDTIDGGAGIDIANYSYGALVLGGLNAFIENGSGTVNDKMGGTDTLINIEGLAGTHTNDTLTGGLGDQWFRGNGGSDTISGGDGNDWVLYSNGPSGVTINLGAGTATDGWNGAGGLLALGGTDTLVSIENAEGSDFADSIVGSAGANELRGRDGNDTLDGGAGADSMVGGTGDDVYYVDSASDVVVENPGEGTDTVISSVGITLPDNVEVIRFTGGASGVITGNAQDNVIAGSTSDDTLIGGGGVDTVSYAYETHPVTVNLETGVATGSGSDTLTGFANAEGGAGNDTLIGNSGANVLDGRAGADTLQGGFGNDTYYVDNALDAVVEISNSQAPSLASAADESAAPELVLAALAGITDTVIAAINYSLANVAYVENLTLNEAGTGTTATGNELENVLTGNALNNTLSGLEGNDTLTGGAGNDTLDGGSGVDTAVFNSNRAANTITKTTSGFTVAGSEGSDTLSNIERLQFSDKKLALDLGVGEAAGNTAKLLGAVFGSASVQNTTYVGIGLQLFDGGMTYAQVADLAIHAALGANPSDADLVRLLYTNVVGSAPDEATTNSFVALITSGQFTQDSLTTFAADYELNLTNINLVGLAQSGAEFV